KRHFERPLSIGILVTQDHHADANENEREESADIGQAHHLVHSRKRSKTAVCATTDPNAMTVFCHNACGATVSSAIVSDSPRCAEVQLRTVSHGTMPVNTAATST